MKLFVQNVFPISRSILDIRGFLAQKLARDLAGNPSQLIAMPPAISITNLTPNLKEGGLFVDISTGK
jgi:hypothetical protein